MRRTVRRAAWMIFAGTGLLLAGLGVFLAGEPLSVLDQLGSIGSFVFAALSLALAVLTFVRDAAAGRREAGPVRSELDVKDVGYLLDRPAGDVSITKDGRPPPSSGRSARPATPARVMVRGAFVVVHGGNNVTISDPPVGPDADGPGTRE